MLGRTAFYCTKGNLAQALILALVVAISLIISMAINLALTPAHASDANVEGDPCHAQNNPDKLNLYTPPPQADDGIAVGNVMTTDFDVSCIHALLARTRLTPDQGGLQELHSLLVFKDGQLLLEEYFFGNDDFIDFENGLQRINRPAIQWSADKKHYVASINKALTSTLAGIAFNQLQMTVDQPLAPALPAYHEYFEKPGKAAITWRDMLTMQSGFVWDEWESDDLKLLWQSEDFTQYLLSQRHIDAHAEWRYNSAVPNVVLHALDNLLDEPIREWADRKFYHTLGITDYRWDSQPGGLPEGSARMSLRPRDMLKIGITWLHNGVWLGQQVVPESWIEAISRKQVSSQAGDYSYYFWLRELDGVSYLSADGDGGQYINVFPEHNLVIIMTAGNYLQWPLYKNQADEVMAGYLFPAFQVEGK